MGHGGFIPNRHAEQASHSSYLVFTHTRLLEGTTHTKFTRCLLPGTEITIVVFIHTISDIAQLVLLGQWHQVTEEFCFTEVATIEIIGNVTLILDFMRF